MCPFNVSFFRRPASLHRVRAVSRSPASSILSGRYDFLSPVSPHFVAFAWRYHTGRLVIRFPPPKTPKRGDLEVLGAAPPPPRTPLETTGSPKFLGNPYCLSAMVSDSGRKVDFRPYKTTTRPPIVTRRRLPQGNFRSSIAWLPDSLSTLRRKSRPFAAQDSLPGAGQALLGGLDYPQDSDERFQK